MDWWAWFPLLRCFPREPFRLVWQETELVSEWQVAMQPTPASPQVEAALLG